MHDETDVKDEAVTAPPFDHATVIARDREDSPAANSWTARSLLRRYGSNAVLAGAVAAIVLNGWLALRALDKLESSHGLVVHTWQVIAQVERILSTERDAEIGNRGYLITGKGEYLAMYRNAAVQLPQDVEAFRELTVDNPVQRTRVAAMRAAVSDRLSTLDQAIADRNSGKADMVQTFLQGGSGKEQMDRLRRLGDDADEEESKLLHLRTDDAARSMQIAKTTLVLASALDLLLALLISRYFYRERQQRLRTESTARQLATARAETEQRAEEIRQLNRTLEERVHLRTVELETTNRELEAFSYSVSHDLRAPLRTVDGFSSALEEDYADVLDATGRDYIQRVRTGVQRMGQLIDALLQLSRITRADISRETVDLSALALSVFETVREENPGRSMETTVEPGLTIHADSKLMRVALENLFNNAAKFTSKREHAAIQFGWDPEKEAWFVRDNGAGFDMYYAHKLFNAFNRLHGDKDFKGSGIGLATVARVIRRHHGEIWAESEVDHGATFWFTVR